MSEDTVAVAKSPKVISAYDQFESDLSLEAEGVWVPMGTMQFKLARAGGENEQFVKVASKSFKPYQAAIAADAMPKELAFDLVLDVFIETVLRDWKDVYDRDKQLIPYSREAAKKLFQDLPNLFSALQTESLKLANYRRVNLEAAAKN